MQAPVSENRDYPRYPYGSIDLRESVQESLDIDANAHMRKEAQPVRPDDSQQSFDEPISSKAVSKEAGGEKQQKRKNGAFEESLKLGQVGTQGAPPQANKCSKSNGQR